jgi:hypothetical protein
MEDEIAERPPWLVRVRTPDGAVAGAGILVAEHFALTCAHVVNSALGQPSTKVSAPAGDVLLDFPFSSTTNLSPASVIEQAWEPINQLGEGDMAIIRLASNAPDDTRQVPWVPFRSVWGHPYRAYGFPPGNDRGEWARGELLGPTGRDWIQLEAMKVTGAAVEQGFSGSPVWDERLRGVVGMIVAEDLDRQQKTAFMIPIQVLSRLLDRVHAPRNQSFDLLESINAGKRQLSHLRSRSLYRKNFTVSGLELRWLAESLCSWYRDQGLRAQILQKERLLVVQCTPPRDVLARKMFMPALTTELTTSGDTLTVEISRGKWAEDKNISVAVVIRTLYLPTVALAGSAVLFFQNINLATRTLEVIEYYIYAGQG